MVYHFSFNGITPYNIKKCLYFEKKLTILVEVSRKRRLPGAEVKVALTALLVGK